MFRQYYEDQFGTKYIPDRTPEDHGLDSETVDELYALAGGADEPSSDSSEGVGSDGLSENFLESNSQELISPSSPKSYSSDDENADKPNGSSTHTELVSSQTLQPPGSGSGDGDASKSHGSAIQHQPSNHSTVLNGSSGFSYTSLLNTQAVASGQKHSVNVFSGALASSSQPQERNVVSGSSVTSATHFPSQVPSNSSMPKPKAVHKAEDTAMAGIVYHPQAKEVEMTGVASNLPIQQPVVNTISPGGAPADTATAMEDTEMSGVDVSKVPDQMSTQSRPSTTTAAGNNSGFSIPIAASSAFWSAPKPFNPDLSKDTQRPSSSAKNEVTPQGTIFSLKGLSFEPSTTWAGVTSFNTQSKFEFGSSKPSPSAATIEPDVAETVVQAPTMTPQVVEEQPGKPSDVPADAVDAVSEPLVVEVLGEDGKRSPAGEPDVAEAKAIPVTPRSEVAASPVASAFTFKASQCGFAVPTVPSGFDAGSWAGGFDFKPSVDDDVAVSVSSSGDGDVGQEVTKVQEHQADEPIVEAESGDGQDLASSSSVDDHVIATIDRRHAVQELPVVENAWDGAFSAADNVSDIMTKMDGQLKSLALQSETIEALDAKPDELEQAALVSKTKDTTATKPDEQKSPKQKRSEKEPGTKKPQKAVPEDCSNQIKELVLVINACETAWRQANSGGGAPSAFVKLAQDLDSIGAEITREGDFQSPLALIKIGAFSTKWQAFANTIKAYSGITEYFHPDYDYRFKRIVEQYRSDVEMLSEYEALSQLPGAPDLWQNEADKRREAKDDKLETVKNEISKMLGLYEAYYVALETLRVHFDCEALKEFADETLIRFHAHIVQANEAFDLAYVEIPYELPHLQDEKL
jgi:hypothetical protein